MASISEFYGRLSNILKKNRTEINFLSAKCGLREKHVVVEILTSNACLVGTQEETRINTSSLKVKYKPYLYIASKR